MLPARRRAINVRIFAWHHVIALYRHRRQVLPLNSALFLTQGSPLSAAAVLSGFNPSRAVEMAVSGGGNGAPALFGQMITCPGAPSARLSFFAPDSAVSNSTLLALVDYFAARAGSHGAFRLLAELEERHPAFENLRRSGFSVYSWQRIWQFPVASVPVNGAETHLWSPARASDEVAIRSLYHTLVPPLVLAADPAPERITRGLVYHADGDVLAYLETVYGPRGILLYPLIHPDVADPTALISDLLRNSLGRMGRPVYFAIRSYQAWLESSLQQLNGQFAPRQALLVKHLVTPQRVAVTAPRYSVLENPQPEPSASVRAHLMKDQN